MPTFDELAIRHRLAEKSVAQLIVVPDTITDKEAADFFNLQGQYRRLTETGLEEKWLRRPSWGQQTVYPKSGVGQHPTRRVTTSESDAAYDARVKFLNQRIASDLQGTIDKIRNAQKVLLDWAGASVTLDLTDIRARAYAEAEIRFNAQSHRERRQIEQPDNYSDKEWAPTARAVKAWEELQARGLNEGWLVTKAHIVVPHPLDMHPNRTVEALETDAVVAARVAGLNAYIAARVSA